MADRWTLLILALHLSLLAALSESSPSSEKGICERNKTICRNGTCHHRAEGHYCQCNAGFTAVNEQTRCIGICELNKTICGNGTCHLTAGGHYCQCDAGFTGVDEQTRCIDDDECTGDVPPCGKAKCVNTLGSFKCTCPEGQISTSGTKFFSADTSVRCEPINICHGSNVCDQNAICSKLGSSYQCVCKPGFRLKSGTSSYPAKQESKEEQCEDICELDKTICGNGTCHPAAGGHYCACHAGFTNYGYKRFRCTELRCDFFKDTSFPKESFLEAQNLMVQLNRSCLELTESENPTRLDAEDLLKKLLSAIDMLLSNGAFKDNRKVSTFLDLVENAVKLIGPFLKPPGTNKSSTHTELQLLLHKGAVLPQGAQILSSKRAQLDIQMETAAGDPTSYPGFTTVSMLSYENLEESAEGFFSGMKHKENEHFKINSKVVTVSVSNRNTHHLQKPIKLTLYHLEKQNKFNHTCVFWNSEEDKGTWSGQGCSVVESKLEYTVCSCNHLSSFAVLMALHDAEDKFELRLITWVGLSLSLVCLFICILTFWFIRSIHSPRTTIHLHLCISLFIANLIFLAGISRTENQVGCAVVAGLLHFFYLAAFCWMCLEGVQLFRMVVLVFNTTFKTLYMMAGGYGVPAVIVAVSAIVNSKGYGTKKHCWLTLDFIWSFFGPACFIIIINVFFFLITVWKLAQKFSSLNPDLDKLQKIKVFTITAVAQLCVLGTMWIFGCFQFDEGTVVMSYLFTIFGSLQGVMLFVMHCLFSKQVMEEYGKILSNCCAPRKKRYSEFSSSNTSKAQASKSTQDTGNCRI